MEKSNTQLELICEFKQEVEAKSDPTRLDDIDFEIRTPRFGRITLLFSHH